MKGETIGPLPSIGSTPSRANEPEAKSHMPWLANTFWQLLLSLVLFCCKHC